MDSALAGDRALLDQVLVGGAASLINLAIHAVLLGVVVWTVRNLSARDALIPPFLQYTLVIAATGTLLVIVHFSEVMIWAYTYAWVDQARPGAEIIYLAFGNFTTLGSGIKPIEKWHLLGPMTALNGIMLIGWSTALVIEILRHAGHGADKAFADQDNSQS